MILKHKISERGLYFSVQLLLERETKIIQIKKTFNSKAHITQKKGCFFSAVTGRKQFLLSMKLRNYIKTKLKACRKELCVFSATTDIQKILGILCYTSLATDKCSLIVKTGNGQFVYH